MPINSCKLRIKVDAYPDADFAGTYWHKNPDDPTCAKSRTGFIITFADFPVLWIYKLQTKTALSTMEVETITIAYGCREMFPIINITKYIGKSVGLSVGVPSMILSVHEYKSDALTLSGTFPLKFTPHSKYYETKTIWFCDEINKSNIALLKIATVEQ